ncbi:hypothetical protein B0H13DRAFT_1927455 [Mycena leptocephala]|nr:hypothetical protein B0H13DRAFT_1927455 [Mycena leptocephala]
MQRVPREEDPQYQPPPLPLEVISSDRVPWIKPPPVEKAGGSGKWGKWVQYENSSTDPPSFYIRKRALTWRPQSKHSVWYDRAHRRELYLRADFQVPLGVLEVDLFGCPAPRDLYYESEQLEGVFTPVLRHPSRWMYRTRESPRDIGRVLARPATERLPMKGTSPPTQRLAAYDSDEDDDDGGDSDDDEPPPAPVVRVVESTELVADGPESSSPAAPHTHAVGDEDAEGRLKPQDQEKPMEVESSSPAAPHTHAVGDEDAEGWLKPQDQEKQMEVDIEDNAGMDANVDDDAEMEEDPVSLGEESDDELTCPPKEAEEAESSPPQGCAVGDEDEEGRERAQEEQMEVDGAESSSAAPQTDKGKGRAMVDEDDEISPVGPPSFPPGRQPSPQQRHRSRSPQRHRSRSPRRHRSRSSPRRQSSPGRPHRFFLSSRRRSSRSRSPRRRQFAHSPPPRQPSLQRYRSRSPQRYRSRSPRRYRSRSPQRYRSRSPQRYRSRSPQRYRQQRQRRRLAHSPPPRQHSPPPRQPSPQRRRSRSPLRPPPLVSAVCEDSGSSLLGRIGPAPLQPPPPILAVYEDSGSSLLGRMGPAADRSSGPRVHRFYDLGVRRDDLWEGHGKPKKRRH